MHPLIYKDYTIYDIQQTVYTTFGKLKLTEMGIIYLFNLPTSTERVLNHHTAFTLNTHTTNHPAAFPFHKRLFAH